MNGKSWVEHVFRPVAVSVMVGCIALSLVSLVRLLVPAWNGAYLVTGCVLAALEASTSYRLIRTRPLRGDDVVRFRAFEIATFFILLKVGSYVGDPWVDVLADVRTWPRQPWNILNPETVVAFILTLLSWQASTRTARDLERIGEPPEHDRRYVPPIESLTNRFFWGGGALLFTAGITRVGIAALLDLRRPSVPGLVLNVLAYYLLGLVMFGQMQFTRLRTQWREQEIRIADELTSRWARYSVALIGLAALVAFLLPTGYTVGLLDVVGTVIGFISYAVTLLFAILWLLLGLLLWPLTRLLGIEPSRRPAAPPLLEPPQAAPGGASGPAPGWFEILRSLLFWTATLTIVFYVMRSYLRDRPELLQALASLRPVRVLRNFLAGLWRRLRGLAQAVNERIPRRLALRRRRRGPAEKPFGFFRLGALSPRQRVLYYYLSILRRAGQQGFPRKRAQTPQEYDATLSPHLPQARQEMRQLTEGFVEARYSTHTLDRPREQQIRARWRRVRAALQELKHQANSDGKT